MAALVAEGASQVVGTEVRLKSVDEADHTDLTWCDGIALGSPTHYGTVSWQMKKWWDELPIDLWGKIDGKIGSVFSSGEHGEAVRNGHAWPSCPFLSISVF